jgi:hypothetical protein
MPKDGESSVGSEGERDQLAGDAAPGHATGETAIEVAFAGVEWKRIAVADDAGEIEAAEAQRVADELDARLQSILGTERLVILTGLGTSRSVTDADGNRPAPSMSDLWVTLSTLKGFADSCDATNTATDHGDVETFLSRCHFALALTDDASLRTFVDAAEQAILDRCRFVTNDTDLGVHELFLRKVARRSTRLPRTQLFTTNYDLVWERAADRAGFHVVDGFGLSHPHRFDGGAFDVDYVRRRTGERPTFEPNVVQLLKLHGSVDWTAQDGDILRDPDPKTPVLIYPAQTKFQLSYQTPYLECMARFQMALRDPSVAIIVLGFGFNDEHIAGPLRSAISSNVGLRLVVVDPIAKTGTNDTLSFIRNMIALGDARLALISGGFGNFAKFLPEVSAAGEREAHETRLDEATRIVEA